MCVKLAANRSLFAKPRGVQLKRAEKQRGKAMLHSVRPNQKQEEFTYTKTIYHCHRRGKELAAMGKKGKNATNASKGGGNSDLKDLEQKTKLQARRLPYSKVDDATGSRLPRFLQAML